jgi:beta-galactosidase
MAHILPHWNWPERVGQITPVHVYSSGDEAELFLNGKSLGRKRREPLAYRFRWDDVVYRPGELRVVAYRVGARWAEATCRTAGRVAAMMIEADRGELVADGRDLAYATVALVDAKGVPVPRSDRKVRFSVQGPAEIVATDNGDPTGLVAFSSHERSTFGGLALAIVRTRAGEPGRIVVRAESQGLPAAETRIQSAGAARRMPGGAAQLSAGRRRSRTRERERNGCEPDRPGSAVSRLRTLTYTSMWTSTVWMRPRQVGCP